jgi:hypothetical protein
MCVRVYMCMYVCMCVAVHMCVCMYLCVYVCVCVYEYVCVCMHVCACMHVYTLSMSMDICICICICMRACNDSRSRRHIVQGLVSVQLDFGILSAADRGRMKYSCRCSCRGATQFVARTHFPGEPFAPGIHICCTYIAYSYSVHAHMQPRIQTYRYMCIYIYRHNDMAQQLDCE